MLLFLISFIDICLMSNKMLTVNYIFCWTLRNEYTHVVVVKLLSFVQLLQLHGLQHTRLPCPSVSPGVCLNSCPLSQWGHPTTASSVIPSSSCPQSLPALGFFFPMIYLFLSGGQSTGASASASVLPMKYSELISFWIDWFDILTVHVTLKSLLQPPQYKSINSLAFSLFMVQLSHMYMTTGKNHSFDYMDLGW